MQVTKGLWRTIIGAIALTAGVTFIISGAIDQIPQQTRLLLGVGAILVFVTVSLSSEHWKKLRAAHAEAWKETKEMLRSWDLKSLLGFIYFLGAMFVLWQILTIFIKLVVLLFGGDVSLVPFGSPADSTG